nr:hypothetical protein Iba_chr12bCG17110 [Ipomoea batatas]
MLQPELMMVVNKGKAPQQTSQPKDKLRKGRHSRGKPQSNLRQNHSQKRRDGQSKGKPRCYPNGQYNVFAKPRRSSRRSMRGTRGFFPYDEDWFIVHEPMLKAQSKRLAAHRNHYYMKTKPPSSKKKDVVPIVDHALSKQKKKALAANGVSIVNAPKGASAKDKAKTSKKPSKKKPSDPVP